MRANSDKPRAMKNYGFALLIGLWCMSLGHAGELCEQAQIQELKMGKSENLCLKLDQELNPTEIKTLRQLKQLHEQVAKLLKVELSELFHLPLKVSLDEYVFGPFLSSGNATHLNLGVYPGDEFQINNGVYLHELGHVLAAAKNPKLPAVFQEFDNSVLFSETFADLLALSVHGEIITPTEQSTCLDRLRYISTFQSYNYPAEYFQNLSEARLKKCCDSLVKTGTEEKYLNLCQAAEEYFSHDIQFTHVFDPLNTKDIDDHQIGLPILSFFKDFAQQTGESMGQIFERIFLNGKAFSQENFRCGSLEVKAHTATNMLNDFKQTLPLSHIALFDSLYRKHALAKGMVFSKLDTIKKLNKKLSLECESLL